MNRNSKVTPILVLAVVLLVGYFGAGQANAVPPVLEEPGGPKCDCRYTNGDLGVQYGGTCNVQNCWQPISLGELPVFDPATGLRLKK